MLKAEIGNWERGQGSVVGSQESGSISIKTEIWKAESRKLKLISIFHFRHFCF